MVLNKIDCKHLGQGFSGKYQPDLLLFVCKSQQSGYLLELGFEYFRDHLDYLDLMGSVLYIQVVEQQILPTAEWKSYRHTCTSILEEIPESVCSEDSELTEFALAG